MTHRPSGTEPGLEADYPLDDGQGLTAHDLTSNHNDGTLAAISGDLPAWVVGSGEAIDLGDDGITYNASAPRQGPNNLQNFPIIVTTADGGLEGWLGGSTPDTTFRIDVFASAGYSAAGCGAGAGLPRLAGRDHRQPGPGHLRRPVHRAVRPAGRHRHGDRPQGNTSEVSAARITPSRHRRRMCAWSPVSR